MTKVVLAAAAVAKAEVVMMMTWAREVVVWLIVMVGARAAECAEAEAVTVPAQPSPQFGCW